MPIFDSHLDLASNALFLDRDLLLPLEALAGSEHGMDDLPYRGRPTLSLPEMRRAGVRLCSPTVLARVRPEIRSAAAVPRSAIDYATGEAAHAMGLAQIAYYELLAARGELRIITTAKELDAFVREQHVGPADRGLADSGPEPVPGDSAPSGSPAPIGCILSMEGADPVLSPDQAALWWERGLRFASLVHYGEGRYAGGTGSTAGVTSDGRDLLRAFEQLGLVLDLTHLSEPSFYEALESFAGPVLASHNNCRHLVPGDRQFSDEQFRLIVERDGVIGVACDAWMLYPGWERGVTQPDVVSLEALVDHIDHICNLAGNADHVAIGSDLDGLYGWEQTPYDLRSIADLQKLPQMLRNRGYETGQIEGIMYRNWIRFFSRNLPAHGG